MSLACCVKCEKMFSVDMPAYCPDCEEVEVSPMEHVLRAAEELLSTSCLICKHGELTPWMRVSRNKVLELSDALAKVKGAKP